MYTYQKVNGDRKDIVQRLINERKKSRERKSGKDLEDITWNIIKELTRTLDPLSETAT